MPQKIIAAAPDQSLRPLTQILVGALEIALDEILTLRGGETGPWVDDLEQAMLHWTQDFNAKGVDANAVQVAVSVIRETVRSVLR